jgi:SpoVK/Ycf46/Vps4 family AAA+-type ATPase
MGELRDNILRQQLQAELEQARELESKGKDSEAGVHYVKAAEISRMLAYHAPRGDAEDFFDTAHQYESMGNIIKTTTGFARASSPDIIDQLIVVQKPKTKWDDIGGLEDAKRTLKEAIILPFIKERPVFVRMTKSVLLYGPPGTGKTMLAKASSNTLSATFFEAKASGLLSKYFGESSKIIDALFSKARKMQPSLIFMDEIDSLAPSRDTGIDESSRRVLAQILQGIEGFETSPEDKVIFIGATNKPWDLDDALLSRFQKKVLIPLPDEKSRKSILEIHMKGADLGELDMQKLVERSDGYSGRDIASLCQEAILNMIREKNPDLDGMTSSKLETYKLRTRPMEQADFDSAFKKIKPTSKPESVKRYEEWGRQFA